MASSLSIFPMGIATQETFRTESTTARESTSSKVKTWFIGEFLSRDGSKDKESLAMLPHHKSYTMEHGNLAGRMDLETICTGWKSITMESGKTMRRKATASFPSKGDPTTDSGPATELEAGGTSSFQMALNSRANSKITNFLREQSNTLTEMSTTAK